MDCGHGVPLCGILALSTGLGSGAYHSKHPGIHGLWPQVSPYGNSRCAPPDKSAMPEELVGCYRPEHPDLKHDLWFEQHEWSKHGRCAGARNATDYLRQACGLAAGPLRVMQGARLAGMDLADTADQLVRSGYCVWGTASAHREVYLSACAGPDGRWRLAPRDDFPRVCGGAQPSPAGQQCVPNTHGPRCRGDSDCIGVADCVRCAKSGFCTTQPL